MLPPAPHPYPKVVNSSVLEIDGENDESVARDDDDEAASAAAPRPPQQQHVELPSRPQLPPDAIGFESTSATKFSRAMLEHLTNEEKDDIIFTLQIENAKVNDAYEELKAWSQNEIESTIEMAATACDEAHEQMEMYRDQAEVAKEQLDGALRKLELAHRREMLFRGKEEGGEEQADLTTKK
jgi:hypothetical protein